MHCPRCRTPAGDDARSCRSCGAPLTWLVLMPDGEPAGPYAADELAARVADGRVPPTAYVIQEATGIQMPLSRAGFLPADAAGPTADLPLRRPRDRTAWLVAGTIIAITLVIAVLIAAVVVPLVARAKGNARQVACMSNVKQLGYACIMYSQDHAGLLPPARDPQSLQSALLPYVRVSTVFACPDAPDEPGYRLNPSLVGKDVTAVPQPAAQWPMLWDASGAVGGIEPVAGTTPNRHRGNVAVAFADGHVQWHTMGTVQGFAVDPFAAANGPAAP